MKMKTVCEITGLTPRTVRVYIEEQLISPNFTENYLGRRNFDFSHEDIRTLQDIATLRKHGFSIGEIREILLDSSKSIEIIQNVKDRTQKERDEYNARLNALARIQNNRAYSVSELSVALSESALDLPIPVDTEKHRFSRIIKATAVIIAVWLPIALSIFVTVCLIPFFTYPVINPKGCLVTLLALSPSICFLIFSKIRSRKTSKHRLKTILRRLLILLCVLSIPISMVMPLSIYSHSETTDFRDYRKFDPDCLANRDILFQELFPAWPHYYEVRPGGWDAVYLDAEYYYYYFRGMDYTYDIYARWPLEAEAFEKEVQRVRTLYETTDKDNGTYRLAELKRGDYTCLIWYNGDAPFQKATNNYFYLIFAYNPTDHMVRYICCDSLENGVDQPYYLQLDW